VLAERLQTAFPNAKRLLLFIVFVVLSAEELAGCAHRTRPNRAIIRGSKQSNLLLDIVIMEVLFVAVIEVAN
jgi:hypothetical protein